MLDLRANIKQREESCSRFTKPVIDPRTGEEKKDEAGDAIKFVPNSIRTKNPVNTSNQYKDDPRMKVQEDAALADHIEWQQKMTNRAEQRSKLEIEVRYDDLKKKVYKCAHDIATGWYLDCFYRKLTPSNSQLSKEEYTNIVASKLISGFSEDQAKVFGFKADEPMNIDDHAPATAAAAAASTAADAADTFSYLSEPDAQQTQSQNDSNSDSEDRGSPIRTASDVFAADYCKTCYFDLDKTKKDTHYEEEKLIQLLISKMKPLFASITYELWETMDEADLTRRINALQLLDFKPKTITDATEAVSTVIDKIDLANPPKELDDYVDKRLKKEMAKLRRELATQKRLNCSGGSQNQESRPTKNGASSKRERSEDSTNSTPAKRKKKKGPKNNPANDTRARPSKAKKSKAASRGGSRGGDKRSDAERR
jgi:hypothetical protein